MVYDVIEKRCFLKECVNPNLFSEWRGSKSDYSIQISQRANVQPNKLLAKGEDVINYGKNIQFYLEAKTSPSIVKQSEKFRLKRNVLFPFQMFFNFKPLRVKAT